MFRKGLVKRFVELAFSFGIWHTGVLLLVLIWRVFPWPGERGRYAIKAAISRLLDPERYIPMWTDVGWLFLKPFEDRLQRTIFYSGAHYEIKLSSFIRNRLHLCEGDVVWDVGGHIGYYALCFANRVGPKGEIVVFEPQQELSSAIARSAAFNDLNSIIIENRAVGSANGELTMYCLADAGRTSAASTVKHEAHGAVSFAMTCLDEYAQHAQAPSVLKIDVEGSELNVLLGARSLLSSSSPPILLIEIHPEQIEALGGSQDNLVAYLMEFDHYSLRRIHHRLGIIQLPQPLPQATSWHLYAEPIVYLEPKHHE